MITDLWGRKVDTITQIIYVLDNATSLIFISYEKSANFMLLKKYCPITFHST